MSEVWDYYKIVPCSCARVTLADDFCPSQNTFQFQLPGSQLVFLPKLFITVIAHTPVVCTAANQVSSNLSHTFLCALQSVR